MDVKFSYKEYEIIKKHMNLYLQNYKVGDPFDIEPMIAKSIIHKIERELEDELP